VRRAFVGGVSVLDSATMNALLELQDYAMVFNGTQYDQSIGDGVVENSVADYAYYIRFTAPENLGYIELEVDRDGTGEDISYEIRDNTFNPDGSNDGVLIYGPALYPKQFVDTTAGNINLLVGAEGFTAGNYYWLVIEKAGGATNKIDLIGETTTNASYPVYRRSASTGAWTSSEQLHFRVFEWTETGDLLISEEGGQIDWFEYDTAGNISEIKSYIPAIDGDETKSIREILTLTGIRKGVVTSV
jgi:hypothetical protein